MIDSATIKEIKEFNRNVRWLKEMQNKDRWVSAHEVSKQKGWTKYQLSYARQMKKVEFKKSPTGGYLYNINSIK